jgi:acetyl-CoA carboxylase biotin carboxylase subunit
VARSCSYYNAGTVEFILDEKLDFYFLEMNTRLQVEHPVTEQITGLDLVRLQILIAQGEQIPFRQEDLKINGHAVEARVYAEDPSNNFLPDIGLLRTYTRPQGPGIRVDDGLEKGMEIPFYYDPMIAKLICHADTRKAAIEKMIRAIDEYNITGLETTLGFCRFVMTHDAFRSGNFDTRFVENFFSPGELNPPSNNEEEKIASALGVVLQLNDKVFKQENHSAVNTKWKRSRLK